ncbi:dual-specificity RNA methyltransferase RlmN [Fusibacter tunisiensis]|uniref:Probable dual-specificity RNA methyltransferase RlmN n=1 Tax=Fusibacter tunisiensis TaxID=1008308 RepID=A0ABS2MRV9_9FIRM|nr:23S rRNA (adenine2503-C2)-methyltransferase [Fusibacter tunisiensis]
MKDLRNISLAELEAYIIGIGEKKFRAKQVFDWVTKGIATFDAIHNLPQGLVKRLEEDFILDNYKIVDQLASEDGTLKVLGALYDGNIVESVFMTYKHGHSLCISTQVGCKMKCSFCASTLNGVVRNLSAGEMMGQIFALQNLTGKRIDNVVLMGSGEPLDNYDETLKFIRLATFEKGLNLSGRSITLSTCGLTDKIRRLAEEKLQITLAISLHNAIESERLEIMPVTQKNSIQDLMRAVDYYISMTNRRVTFEYALIQGVNDSEKHAHELGCLLKGKLVHVNLIPINAVQEFNFHPSTNYQINGFKKILLDKYKVNTTVRRELGSDINAACGQLRNKHL